MKKSLSDMNSTYKEYIESLSTYTLNKMKKEREDKLQNLPHLIKNRDEMEREFDIINEVLDKRK